MKYYVALIHVLSLTFATAIDAVASGMDETSGLRGNGNGDPVDFIDAARLSDNFPEGEPLASRGGTIEETIYEEDIDEGEEDDEDATYNVPIEDVHQLQEKLTLALQRHLSGGEEEQEEFDVETRTSTSPMVLKGQSAEKSPEMATRDMRRKKQGRFKRHGRFKRQQQKRAKAKKGRPGRNNFGAGGNINNCLPKPDPYRTCFQRAVDPYSGLDEDTVDRKRYNQGAKMWRQGKRWTPPSKGTYYYDEVPLKPYSRPYTRASERLIKGTMHLALLQDSTNVNCNNMIQIEELTLNFLADNIGSEQTFQPVCVFTKNDAHDKQEVPDSNGKQSESNTLELEITYIQKSGAGRNYRALDSEENSEMETDIESSVQDERDLRKKNRNRCTAEEKALCCSQNAINDDTGAYCENAGCSTRGCGNGRLPRRKLEEKAEDNIFDQEADAIEDRNLHARHPSRNIPPFNLYNTDFNNMVRRWTNFKPEESRAILDASNTKTVAVCSANRYSIDRYDEPSLTCDEFDDKDCEDNEDILPHPDDSTDCIDPFDELGTVPTLYPTATPTMYPTLHVSPFVYLCSQVASCS